MKPELSIVTTLYKSAPYLQEFYERITKVAREVTENYNLVIVNDGSPDDSLEIALSIQKKDPRVIIINLSRNFGHHRAIMTGLSHAKGDYIFLIDCDLEEDPELLLSFWEKLEKSKDVDLIYGRQKARRGGIFVQASGFIFYKMVNVLSGVPIPKNVTVMRLMTRRYLNNLLLHTERELVLAGISVLTGFNQEYIEVDLIHKGTSTYTLGRKINMAFNFITSLSSAPLVFIFYVGLFMLFFTFLLLLWFIYSRLAFQVPLGWTSVVISIWFVGGIIILFLGIIGIYLSKIFIEVKNRPYTIIKEIYKKEE